VYLVMHEKFRMKYSPTYMCVFRRCWEVWHEKAAHRFTANSCVEDVVLPTGTAACQDARCRLEHFCANFIIAIICFIFNCKHPQLCIMRLSNLRPFFTITRRQHHVRHLSRTIWLPLTARILFVAQNIMNYYSDRFHVTIITSTLSRPSSITNELSVLYYVLYGPSYWHHRSRL
jgi:hypothetical protein